MKEEKRNTVILTPKSVGRQRYKSYERIRCDIIVIILYSILLSTYVKTIINDNM